MPGSKRVKLKGALDKTATWAEVVKDGGLVIEFYDFSDNAKSALSQREDVSEIDLLLRFHPQYNRTRYGHCYPRVLSILWRPSLGAQRRPL